MVAVRQLLVLAVLVGCDAPRRRQPAPDAPVPAGATPAAASTDTIVRRVYRVTLRASAMQRVTGALAASRASTALDSVLAVRVLDQRSEELPGVPVRWTLEHAGDGASLRVLNATTDSLGQSRAMFTPGRSANPQSAVAEVANVGRIAFAVTVNAASIRVVPERSVVWAGDTIVVATEIRDVAGAVLPGGVVSFAATDTSAIRVKSDSAGARVIGALAGSTGLVAWVGDATVRDTAIVIVRPVIAGRFLMLDGAAPPPMRLEVRAPGIRDSVAVEGASFSKRVELPPETDVEVHAATIGDTTTVHRVRLLVNPQRELQNLAIVLVPTTFRIPRGTFAGREQKVDATLAMRRSGRTAPFWRLVPATGKGPRKLLGWPEPAYPLRIAFDRRRSNEPISAEDSVAFWTIARQMEQDLGAALFTPAQMPSDSNVVNVVPVEIGLQGLEGHTFVSWGQAGDATNAVLLFRREATLRDSHVVTHELVHLLGFGHATAWPTIAQPAGSTEQRLTAEDVAYIQLAMTLRRLQLSTGARPGLPIAVQ